MVTDEGVPMLAHIHTRADHRLDATPVTVQTHISRGLPAFTIVGLPSASVKESKERVRSALLSARFKFPDGRITINLSPATISKTGGRYDLAIALGILVASGQLQCAASLDDFEIYGELSLDGSLVAVEGLFPAILQAKQAHHAVIIPQDCDTNLSLIEDITLYTARHLLDVVAFFQVNTPLDTLQHTPHAHSQPLKDMSEVKGQHLAKRALEIAASGGHNLLLSGPPGAGKTMLAERMTTITPELSTAEVLELGALYSLAGVHFDLSSKHKVMRSPHHSASSVAIIGGGTYPKPGEISLAHHGILFLDEFPEFKKDVLEALREPLESNIVHISRAKSQVSYPANFQLIAAQNPCPCGFFGDGTACCHCTSEQVHKYQTKVSGPLLDRIDIKLSIQSVDKAELLHQSTNAESSATIKERVLRAVDAQMARQGILNAHLGGKTLEQVVTLSDGQKELLSSAIDKLGLSARSFTKVLKVARTIADLAGSAQVEDAHLLEALNFQRL